MKKPISYLIICLFVCLTTNAQSNLVPNASFEDMYLNTCSPQMGFGQYNVTFPMGLKAWYQAKGSPDYYNTCANSITSFPYPNPASVPNNCDGYQLAHTGFGFSGTGIYYQSNHHDSTNISSELMGIKLQQPLKANSCYYGEFYVSLANLSDVGINQIGMLFTTNIFTLNYLSYNNTVQPQIQWDTTRCFIDTLNWVKISGRFIAQGGEQYLTLGNFKDGIHVKKHYQATNFANVCNIGNPENVSYIYVDDVALYELPSPQIPNKAITICPNADTLVLGDTARIQTHYQWFANGIAIDTSSYIKVKPNQTTTYVLQSTNCITTTQTVVVTYSANCEPVVVVEPIIPNVFTPNNDSVNDVWRFNLGKGNVLKSLSIINRWGNSLTPALSEGEGAVQSRNVVLWDGYTTSGEPVSAGIYFYVLQYTDANGDEHKKNGYITLIR